MIAAVHQRLERDSRSNGACKTDTQTDAWEFPEYHDKLSNLKVRSEIAMGDVEISFTFNLRFGGELNCKKVRPTEATLAAADKHSAWCAAPA